VTGTSHSSLFLGHADEHDAFGLLEPFQALFENVVFALAFFEGNQRHFVLLQELRDTAACRQKSGASGAALAQPAPCIPSRLNARKSRFVEV
jgi:hypothetical protein